MVHTATNGNTRSWISLPAGTTFSTKKKISLAGSVAKKESFSYAEPVTFPALPPQSTVLLTKLPGSITKVQSEAVSKSCPKAITQSFSTVVGSWFQSESPAGKEKFLGRFGR